jgi:tRNA (adenine57-N1/adenine58-N1)-methyltransferase
MMAKVIIGPEKRVFVEDLARDVRVSKFEKYYLNKGKEFHSKHGKAIVKDKFKVKNKEFFSFDSMFIDDYKQIKRSVQIIPLKDIGLIIAETGLNKKSVVVEAGSGSGGFTCFIANIVKKLYSLDIKEENIELTKENCKKLNIKNVVFKKESIYNQTKISITDADLLLLDVPEPWKALKTAKKILKKGGFIVIYQPYLPQTIDFIKSITKDFLVERTVEVKIREWEINDRKVRPGKEKIAHSAFLTFVRRIN